MSVEVLDFEEFAAKCGANKQDIGDCGLHNPAAHMPRRAFARALKCQAQKDHHLIERRKALRVEYDNLVRAGSIQPPNRVERLSIIASGREDKHSTHAARRLLAKMQQREESPS